MLISILARTVETSLKRRCVSGLVPAIVLLCTPCVATPTDPFAGAIAAHVPAFASPGEPPANGADQKKGQSPGADPAPDKSETPDSEPEEKLVLILEGQITNLIGAGVVDVDVTVRRKGKDGKPGEVISSTKSDKLGDFKIELPEPIHGDVVVTMAKASYQDVVEAVHLGDDDYPPFVVATLEGNLTLSGRVTDAATKKGVKGASVEIKSAYKDWHIETDSNGRFSVKGMTPTQGEIVVEASGYGRESVNVASLGTDEDVAIELKPERIIHLVVIDESERPVSGVTIETYDDRRDDFRVAVTDAKGMAVLRKVHFDTARIALRLSHPAYVSSIGFDREILPPEDKIESTHRLTIKRAGRITGKVNALDTGETLYGARVMTGTHDNTESPREWTDFDGKYTIHGVEPGPVTITVHLAGYAPELVTGTVTAGEESSVDIALGPPRSLVGVVKNDRGEPVGGVQVVATGWRDAATLGLRAMTDRDGRFFIENAPSDEFEITVFGPRIEATPKVVSATPGNVVEFTVTETERGQRPGGGPGLKVGDDAPDAVFVTLDGTRYELAKLKGKVVLLDFWATWCGPCVADLPHLKKMYDQVGSNERFLMIGISLDWDKKLLEKFLDKQKILWPQVFDSENKKGTVADLYEVMGIPALFLIGPDGKIDAIDPRAQDIPGRIEVLLKPRDPS